MVEITLVPLCPSLSKTSVSAIQCLVAAVLEKGRFDPVGEFVY